MLPFVSVIYGLAYLKTDRTPSVLVAFLTQHRAHLSAIPSVVLWEAQQKTAHEGVPYQTAATRLGPPELQLKIKPVLL